MKYFIYTISIIIFTTLSFCSSKNRVYVYSPDKKQCITIITNVNERYVINGKHRTIPSKNYIKYSFDSIDVEVGDEIVGHWKNSNYVWELATDNAIIIDNKLDTTKFKFNKNFPKDDKGIPTLMNYTDENSFDIGFDHGKIIHYKGAIIEK